MSAPVRVVESQSINQGYGCDRVCDDHAREAEIIQSSLLPSQEFAHESVEIAFHLTPFTYVGGDFADFFRLPDGYIGIYLGDVVGKGLPAAMYGALAMGTLRGIHKTGRDTAQVLAMLNDRLVQRPIPGRFCATLYALFDPATRQLMFTNAGMPFPLLLSGAGCQKLGEGGLPSGMFPGVAYERHIVQLSRGDCVLFASDGLHEAQNNEGVEFCNDQIDKVWAQCRSKSARESVEFILARQSLFSEGNAPHDDITAVVLKVAGTD